MYGLVVGGPAHVCILVPRAGRCWMVIGIAIHPFAFAGLFKLLQKDFHGNVTVYIHSIRVLSVLALATMLCGFNVWSR